MIFLFLLFTVLARCFFRCCLSSNKFCFCIFFSFTTVSSFQLNFLSPLIAFVNISMGFINKIIVYVFFSLLSSSTLLKRILWLHILATISSFIRLRTKKKYTDFFPAYFVVKKRCTTQKKSKLFWQFENKMNYIMNMYRSIKWSKQTRWLTLVRVIEY